MNYLEAEGDHNPLIRSAIADFAVVTWRGMRLACHLLYGTLLACFYPLLKLPARHSIMRRWSGALLGILHVRLEIQGHLPQPGRQGALLIANHVSWLDVFVVNAASPSCFVAKSEVRTWPLFGLLCRLTRTIFIARDIRRDTLRANLEIARTLREGDCVALFPEGTSSDGSGVRHFHSSLLQCAIDEACPVHPVALRYHDGDGWRSNDANFVGDMTLVKSLHNILRSPSLHATVMYLPACSGAGKNRRELAGEAQSAISAALGKFSPQVRAAAINIRPYRPSLPIQSAYSLLLDPVISKLRKHSHR
jgi:1-acyl-sn-glycerol-3-phosphate acyltransferase